MPNGLQPDGRGSHVLFLVSIGVLAISLVTVAWVGPGGCQSHTAGDRAERPSRPPSPLEDAVDRRRGNEEMTEAPIPEAPELRPLPPRTEPTVRVRIASVRGGDVDLSVTGGVLEVAEVGGRASIARGRALSVRHDGAAWIVRADGAPVSVPGGGDGQLSPARVLEVRARASSGEELPITYAGSRWPGVMRLHARAEPSPGSIDIVAMVPMERYLPGVLAKELYRSWDLETYRAQAIAARSYAVCEAAHWADRRHFDLVAGEASQAWIGETTLPQATRAVSDTRGMLLLYEDRVVPAYYSSCCGGAAANAIDTVTRNPMHDIAPLAAGRSASGARPECCRQSPTYAWSETMPVDEVSRRINAWGRSTGRADAAALRAVVDIRPARVSTSGRPVDFRVRDSAGATAEISAESLRLAMNAPDPMRSASASPSRRIKSGFVEVRVVGGSVTFSGRGHGHGVGLCQYGAEAMSRAGGSWKQILARYYPGAEPSRCW